MSPSIRFLGFAVLGWAAVRAVSLGLMPETGSFALDMHGQPPTPTPEPAPTATLPPIPQTRFDPVEPIVSAGYAVPQGPAGATPSLPPYGYASYPGYPPPTAYPYPIYIPVQQAAYRQSMPVRRITRFTPEEAPIPPGVDDYYLTPGSAAPSTEMAMRSAPIRPAVQVTPTFHDEGKPRGYDRWQLSAWAMMRSRPGPPALAANGMLGGSQGGARLLYRFDPRLGASVRATSALQSTQQGMEIAAGLRAQPFLSIPVAVTIERRQWVGKGIGRSDFALFAEGGVWGRSLPMDFRLDGYLQAGVVGIRQRDWFVDGSATATRPLWRNLSGGFGVWGGAQRGLRRFDAGPRLTLEMGRGMRVHADYRAKLAGNAQPGSGAVVTLAGDF